MSKKPPVKITPEKIYIGTGYLLIGAGDETYHIDLEAFFKQAPMALLKTLYDAHYAETDEGRGINERIRASFADDIDWPWCEPCNSYHHPDNPTCFKRTRNG